MPPRGVAVPSRNPIVCAGGYEPQPGRKRPNVFVLSAPCRQHSRAPTHREHFHPGTSFGGPPWYARPAGLVLLLPAVRGRGRMELCPRNVQEPNGLPPPSPRRLVLKWNLNTGRRGRYEKLRTFGSSRSFLQEPQRIPEPAIDHAAAPRRIDVPHSVAPWRTRALRRACRLTLARLWPCLRFMAEAE